MVRSILVPLDGSAFGEQAVPTALAIARKADAEIHLVHVHQPVVEYVPELAVHQGHIDEERRKEEWKAMDRMVQRIREVSTVPVSSELLDGDITTVLGETAARMHSDLIVMTTHGRGPLARFWLGSVADQLVRESPVPVLLVHPTEGELDLRKEPAFKHMLLPLDGTPLAEQILPPAVEMARLFGTSCTLLRVMHTDVPEDLAFQTRGAFVSQGVRMMVEQLESLQKQQTHEATHYLETVAERIRAQGVHVMTRVVLDEEPATAILNAAEKDCDLVAIETHGFSGLKRLWLGSVADKVIRSSHVPVLVHRPSH